MCQGSTLHREGNQTGWEEWYQRSWVLDSRKFIGGQSIAPDVQLCWPWEVSVWKGIVLVSLDVLEVRRGSQKGEGV